MSLAQTRLLYITYSPYSRSPNVLFLLFSRESTSHLRTFSHDAISLKHINACFVKCFFLSVESMLITVLHRSLCYANVTVCLSFVSGFVFIYCTFVHFLSVL